MEPEHTAVLHKKLSFKKASVVILLSTLVITGSVGLFQFIYDGLITYRSKDDYYRIYALEQLCRSGQALSSQHLAELLHLSSNVPCNLYRFSSSTAQNNLKATGLFKSLQVKAILPSTVRVEYETRVPCFKIIDFENAALDREGHLFPLSPFFPPQRIPELYLGLCKGKTEQPISGPRWGEVIHDPRWKTVLETLAFFEQKVEGLAISLLRVDASYIALPSYGERQMIILLEDTWKDISKGQYRLIVQPRLLRLSADDFKESLERFFVLRNCLVNQFLENPPTDSSVNIIKLKEQMIDLRVPSIALIETITKKGN